MSAGLHQIVLVEQAFNAIGVHQPVHVLTTWVVMAFLFIMGFLATRSLKTVPGPLQNFFEVVIGGLEDFIVGNMGEAGRKVVPILVTIFVFILCLNITGLLPGSDAPTANVNTNAAMALAVFLYYNYWGLRNHGLGYIKHFIGPIPALAPLMFPIEIVSHISRPLSLTLRLFGNIRGEEIVIALLFMLAPIVSTLPIFFLFILMKVLQAFVFFMLSLIYLQGAFEHAH